MIAALGLPGTASADECAPGFVHGRVTTPLDGREVARNIHFYVDESTGCGRELESVPPKYRLVGTRGPVPFDRAASRFDDGELVAGELLPVGPLTVEVRDPIAEDQLGPWHPLITVQVVDRIDESPPVFAGISSVEVAIVKGWIGSYACMPEEGPVVETTVHFQLADDGPTPHDELLYVLDRRRGGDSEWQGFRLFRPHREGDQGHFKWEDEFGFSQTWAYRLRVVDGSGHETIGPALATVTNPARPEEPATEEEPRIVDETAIVLDDHDYWFSSPGQRWAAALATLLGAMFVGLRRRRLGRRGGGDREEAPTQ